MTKSSAPQRLSRKEAESRRNFIAKNLDKPARDLVALAKGLGVRGVTLQTVYQTRSNIKQETAQRSIDVAATHAATHAATTRSNGVAHDGITRGEIRAFILRAGIDAVAAELATLQRFMLAEVDQGGSNGH